MSAPLLQKPDAKTRHAAVELAVIGLSGRHRASIWGPERMKYRR